MTIIAVSKAQESNSFVVDQTAEDIWLLEDGSAISFIDIFISVSEHSSPIKSIKLATLGKIDKVLDVSYFFQLLEKHWDSSVATDQYKSGITKKMETEETLTMSIDEIKTDISQKTATFTHKSFKSPTTAKFGSILRINFNPSIKANEHRGMKICVKTSLLSQKDDSTWALSLYPYSASGVGGVNFFEKEGIKTGTITEVKKYYIQVILPPAFDYDRIQSTKSRSEDFCYCDTCNKFCPYLANIMKGVSLTKERRFFVRWNAENLKEWTDKAIIHLFYFSKPKITRTFLETALKTTKADYTVIAIQILLELEISNRTLSAKDLYQRLSSRGEKAKQGTFYYELRKLKKHNLIAEIPQKSGSYRGKPPIFYAISEKGRKLIGL
ncbi:MAG: PadR family transcriptional regulator [Candidatus Bathyarchaeota archaeon]|nr:PadR family transcriptional regulator [Candidatus Bathyarchaeota archaeon]